MIKLTFKNLEKSNLAREIVLERMNAIVEKFPDLEGHSISLTLSMDNSSSQAGPDEFGIMVKIRGKKFDGLIVEKKARTLYLALAGISEVLLELLNRRTDKLRVKKRAFARKVKRLRASEEEPLVKHA